MDILIALGFVFALFVVIGGMVLMDRQRNNHEMNLSLGRRVHELEGIIDNLLDEADDDVEGPTDEFYQALGDAASSIHKRLEHKESGDEIIMEVVLEKLSRTVAVLDRLEPILAVMEEEMTEEELNRTPTNTR